MDDVEALRQRRLQELQAQKARAAAQDPAAQAEAAAQRAAQEAEAVERVLQQVLEPEARERLQLVRMSRPETGAAVARQLVLLAQAGRLQRRVRDDELRAMLQQAASQDRDIRITRK